MATETEIATWGLLHALNKISDWEDGCLYINGYSSPSLQTPMLELDRALNKVKKEKP